MGYLQDLIVGKKPQARGSTAMGRNDDIEILENKVEYSPNHTKDEMQYMTFKLRLLDDTGEYREVWKAVKLCRIHRVPKPFRETRKLMDMMAEVMGALWAKQVNMVQIMANVLNPTNVGLIFCYGVQAVADSLEAAKAEADQDYNALIAAIQGSFPQMEFHPLTSQEAEWLRSKMASMKQMLMVRGIPVPKRGQSGYSARSTIMGVTPTPDAEEQSEQFIRAMSDKEYVWLLVSSPVGASSLSKWLSSWSQDMSDWKSKMEGSKVVAAGVSVPLVFMSNLGASQGWNRNLSNSETVGHSVGRSEGTSYSESVSQGESTGFSRSVGQSEQVGRTDSASRSVSTGHQVGTSFSESVSRGQSIGDSVSQSYGVNRGVSEGVSESRGISMGESVSTGLSRSQGISDSLSASRGNNVGVSDGINVNSSHGLSAGNSAGRTTGSDFGGSVDLKILGTGGGVKGGASWNQSETNNVGSSDGWGASVSQGTSRGESAGLSVSHGSSYSESENVGRSVNMGSSQSFSTSFQKSTGESMSVSSGQSRQYSESQSISQGVSESFSTGTSDQRGVSLSASRGVSTQDSISTGRNLSYAVSKGVNTGYNESDSVSRGVSEGIGTSQGISRGSSSSMSVGPYVSVSKSYSWTDVDVENLVALMQTQRERLFRALQGGGALYTDVYIFTPDEETKAAAVTAAKSAYYSDILPTPMEVVELNEEESAHQAYHGQAFSTCSAREGIPGILESFRWSTILLSSEICAYVHPVRLEAGGISSVVENVPEFHVPADRKGEIYHGKIVSAARWSPKTGFLTNYDWRISKSELMHTLVCGGSRSGKTVGSTRFVAEVANNLTYGIGPDGKPKRLGIVALDWKRDWRVLARFVPKDKFRFFSLGDPKLCPVRLNVLRIPKGVYAERWVDTVIETFCLGFSLGGRAKSILWQHLTELYRGHDVFKDPEQSKNITMYDLFEAIKEAKIELDSPNSKFGKVGNDVRDAYQRVLDRLVYFEWGILKDLFCHRGDGGLTIEDLCEPGFCTVLEGAGLDSEQKNFIIGVIAAGIYQYGVHNRGFDPGLLVIFEEAHQILKGANEKGGDSTVLNIGETIYEVMFNEAAGLNMFLMAVSQSPSKLPKSVITNCSLVYAYRMDVAQDIEMIVRKIGRDEKYDDRPMAKWFPRQPVGMCVARSGRVTDFKLADPSLVMTAMLDANPPSDDELRRVMRPYGLGDVGRQS